MSKRTDIWDVIIVGGAAAGLTAALYASRRALKTLVITKDLGGQAALTTEIENYPGRDLVEGFGLMSDFEKQAKKFGAQIQFGEVEEIIPQDGDFLVKTSNNQFLSHAIILAFGLTPRDLGVPGEEKFKGQGVSYCATCDAPLFKGKTVVVIGGGNSGLDAADLLAKLGSPVYLIHNIDHLSGDEILRKKVEENTKIKIFLNTSVLEILGKDLVTGIKIKDNQTGKEQELKVQGVFIEIGYKPKTDWVKKLVDLDERGQIIISKDCETSHEGVFAAGDVTNISYKQIVISAGEGAKAALQIYKYLQSHKEETPSVDWGHKK